MHLCAEIKVDFFLKNFKKNWKLEILRDKPTVKGIKKKKRTDVCESLATDRSWKLESIIRQFKKLKNYFKNPRR